MEREQTPKTLVEHGDTLVFVNSVGTLKEWLDAMPIKQSEFDGVGGEELENFGWQTTGHIGSRNGIWETVIGFVGRTIHVRASYSKEIVWHTRPEFSTALVDPDKLVVSCKWRCAFVPKESENVPA